MNDYLRKMKGTTKNPTAVDLGEIFWSWIGAFLGIAAVAYAQLQIVDGTDHVLLVGSFGATAVLLYGAITSPLSQPRNLLGGHVVSALVGVTAYQLLPSSTWLAAALAVATAIALMHATKTLHPPGGATALIAVIGGEQIHDLGYVYALAPAGLGALVMLIVALLINNIPKRRRYPQYWL